MFARGMANSCSMSRLGDSSRRCRRDKFVRECPISIAGLGGSRPGLCRRNGMGRRGVRCLGGLVAFYGRGSVRFITMAAPVPVGALGSCDSDCGTT